ncbi:hypothetical protein PMAYCL1PPCAC_23737 [Pristionchus mayeri]|uniref:SH2 domain-containing protein n=1 Tax=Pristionchus mayeri TaxID=1317129 RepID=A0AAN5D0T7_9BILA|nr:hypothetical protein PMAYCL1PPCAC_23737 [Pristionchus mayeri]
MLSRGSDSSLAHLILHAQACEWYWGDLDWKCAKKMLVSCTPGTYLLRDSRSDSSVFTLSYRTSQKILHSHADDLLLKAAKLTDERLSPLDAFEILVQRCNGPDLEMLLYEKNEVFSNINLCLTSPLRKRDCVPSLQFLSRQRIVDNSHLVNAAQFLPLPIANYIRDSKYSNPPIDECIRNLQQRASRR